MIDKFEADTAIRGLFGMMNPPRIDPLVAFLMQVQEDAAAQHDDLIKRICDAIRAADGKAVDEANYMFDSEDCIKIIRSFASTAGKEIKPNEHGEYPDLQVGQRVRVHTGEEGVIAELRTGYTKRYRVLSRPGFGGVYGSWEVTPIGVGDDRQDG